MPSPTIALLPVVLIVDDYPDTCEMYAAYLDLAGFRSLTANDGYKALQIARRDLPDVILMDLGLPGIDGYEVTKLLKSDPQTRHIPVIALTAHATAQQFDHLVACGFDDLILKPCLPDVLADEVERVVRRVRQQDSAGRGMTQPAA